MSIVVIIFLMIIILAGLFLFEIIKKTTKEKLRQERIIKAIHNFYLYRNLLKFASITKIVVTGNSVVIYSKRPGVLIGKRAKNIEELKMYLLVNYNVESVDLKESKRNLELIYNIQSNNQNSVYW
jgi:ribosomal protein S3